MQRFYPTSTRSVEEQKKEENLRLNVARIKTKQAITIAVVIGILAIGTVLVSNYRKNKNEWSPVLSNKQSKVLLRL